MSSWTIHQVLYNRNKHLERDKLCHGSRGDQFRSDKRQTTRPPNKSRPILRPLERVIKASSHKIVKKSQTVADDRRRIQEVEFGSTFPINTDCRRQSAITTSLCEQDRRLFADFMWTSLNLPSQFPKRSCTYIHVYTSANVSNWHRSVQVSRT